MNSIKRYAHFLNLMITGLVIMHVGTNICIRLATQSIGIAEFCFSMIGMTGLFIWFHILSQITEEVENEYQQHRRKNEKPKTN